MRIQANNVGVGYGDKTVVSSISISFEEGKIHSILGPNGCGKSTFLKVIAKQLDMEQGNVILQNKEIKEWKRRELAQKIAFLMQSHEQTPNITVQNLVSYGRFPHKKPLQRLDKADQEIIDWALELTSLSALATKDIMNLSGGERQRAWIAMALAQKPKVLLLDEPTTFLDIHHQLEIIELVKKLNAEQGMTIIMVLHDLNQAAMISDQLVVLSKGALYANGSPIDVIQPQMLKDVFQVEAEIGFDQQSGKPFISLLKLIK
ncbi:ABC transporter ATP-binding protein [Paenibacillus sp. GSMTC-2017]|uniref:ABC transporter ATP-binding protein n=1 Tax=Paenibacillus sp. GSMTC-2017 TaxID=2794350 RepID=UPI0018D8DAD4|nr:ABC transporter ATP-binding protein [Paenibacillus sp. GSMTC-2017]MBH5317848.1 ABC transporter ATP-binding protein [Paenibacillus sp. GSMTC-2017]